MVLVTIQSPTCLKPFVKAISTLSKIGDEAFLEITDSCVTLQGANSSMTAIVCFRFDRSFFFEYDSRTATVTRSQADKSIGYAVKLSSRSLANSLRMVSVSLSGAGPSVGGLSGCAGDDSGTKHSSSLSVRYDTLTLGCVHPNAGTAENNDFPDDDLTVRLYSSNVDIGRAKSTTFRLKPLETSELMAADFTASTLKATTNHLSAPAKRFSDLLANFATSDRTILFSISPTRFSLSADPLGKSGRWHRIGTDVGPASHFSKYEVFEEINFGCILSELKTFLTYAVSLDWSPTLNIDFSQPGRPILFSVEVADRIGMGVAAAPLCMGSLILSTMTLPAGVSAFAATAAPVATPGAPLRDKRQPQIDTVLKTAATNRTMAAQKRQQNPEPEEVIDLDRVPSPTIRSSLEGRFQQPDISNYATTSNYKGAQSPSIISRRAPSLGVSFAGADRSPPQTDHAPSPVSFLFTELFHGSDGRNRDDLMMSNNVLAGDSDAED